MRLRTAAFILLSVVFLLWCYPELERPENEMDPGEVLGWAVLLATKSWEYGVMVQAMLELRDPALTVFAPEPFPHSTLPIVHDPEAVIGLKNAKMMIRTEGDSLVDGNGFPADPASLGCAALLLGTSNERYFDAARRQAEYLVKRATRFTINDTHSAISHRDDPPQLWGDFVYMVPPFLASYGVATHDDSFLDEAVLQCQLYRDVLTTSILIEGDESDSYDENATCKGLWMHVASHPTKLPSDVCCNDPGVWLTSNAWAVAGITRVLATLLKWNPPQSIKENFDYNHFLLRKNEILVNILLEMLKCVIDQSRDHDSGLLKNYLDGGWYKNAVYAYGDAAGTAMMAAAVYRLAVLLPETFATPTYLHWADTNRRAVTSHVGSGGRVGPVADVNHVPSRGPRRHTSEGQSMVVLMFSAWRDCRRSGICND